MSHPLQTKTLIAGADIANCRIVKPDGTAGQVVAAAASSDAMIGVVDQPGGAKSGNPVDVHLAGIVLVEAGGAISAGALVTSDGSGRGVNANPGAGVNARIIGIAYEAALAAGDLIRVILSPGRIQG